MVAGATLLVIALLVVGVGIAAIIATERDLDSLHLGDVATYTGPTLPPLPASQCASLRGVHKAALAARDIASPLSMPQEPWPTLRRRVNNTLLVFDVALQHAEHAVPAQLAGELHSVRRHVQRGRIFAATSASESAYQGAVLAEIID